MEFVGQSGGTSGKKGLTQKEQIEVVRRFKEGGFNTLVATCVGEEGLDIGEVDLIVCYDVSKSPIRYSAVLTSVQYLTFRLGVEIKVHLFRGSHKKIISLLGLNL